MRIGGLGSRGQGRGRYCEGCGRKQRRLFERCECGRNPPLPPGVPRVPDPMLDSWLAQGAGGLVGFLTSEEIGRGRELQRQAELAVQEEMF